MKLSSYLSFLVVSGLLACQKPTDAVSPGPTTSADSLQATPTEIGQPIGSPITKVISPAGGTLTTPDGRLTLTFPAGAVRKETAITVQPLENKALNGVGHGFAISPTDLSFDQPVTIVYYYRDDEMDGALVDALGLAYQDRRQAWQQTQYVQVDKAKKTATARLKKADQWALFSRYKLSPDGGFLTINESLELNLTKLGADYPSAAGDGFEAVAPLVLGDASQDVAKLYINGVDWTGSVTKDPHWGSISQEPKTSKFLYVAPVAKPKTKNPVQIGIELKNPVGLGAYTLFSTITIQSENSLTIDGRTFDDVVVNGSPVGDQFLFTVAGSDSLGKVGRLSMSLSGLSIGAHPFTPIKVDNKGTWVSALNDGGKGDNIGGTSFYATCDRAETESGSIQIVKVESIAGGLTKVRLQVNGRVATVHNVDATCTVTEHKTMPISARLTVLIKQ